MRPLSKQFLDSTYDSAQQVQESGRVPSGELTKFIDAHDAKKIADQLGFEGQQRIQFIRQSIAQAEILEKAGHSAIMRRQYHIS